MNVKRVAVVVLAMFTAGCAALPMGSGHSGSSITYEVNGSAASAMNVTSSLGSGQQQETQVALPWAKRFKAANGFQSSWCWRRTQG